MNTVVRITIAAISLGVIGLVIQDHYFSNDRAEVWFHLSTHVFSLIGSAGIVGLLFETILREKALDDFANKIREIFESDSRLAKNLSLGSSKRRVESTLVAHLGSEIGSAVYQGVVDRYLSAEKPMFRKDFAYEATLSSLASDIQLTNAFSLAGSGYCRLLMDESFQRPFRYKGKISIVFLLTDSFQDLNRAFHGADCIFRDTFVLCEEDREPVRDFLLGATGSADLLDRLSRFVRVEKLSVDGNNFEFLSAELGVGGLSAEVSYKIPPVLEAGSTLARYEIVVSGLISKEARKYPVIFGEPTQDPRVTFRYSGTDIMHVAVAPFFAGRSPFDIRIETFNMGEIKVSLPRSGNDHDWVFPSSGAIFLWEPQRKAT